MSYIAVKRDLLSIRRSVIPEREARWNQLLGRGKAKARGVWGWPVAIGDLGRRSGPALLLFLLRFAVGKPP